MTVRGRIDRQEQEHGQSPRRATPFHAGRRIPRRTTVLWFLALLAAAPPAIRARTVPPALPVLRTARQARLLSSAEAARGYKVRLSRAQVTFYQPSADRLFLTDTTDSIFVSIGGESPALRTGDIVSVDGITSPGKIAPFLLHPRFRILGHAPLPKAPLVGFDRLSTGAYDARWVTAEGIVRSVSRPPPGADAPESVEPDPSELILQLASGADRMEVLTFDRGDRDYHSLIDARVRLRATAGSRFNQRRQLLGVRLFMPDLSFVRVEEPPPADPFSLPLMDTSALVMYGLKEPGHRVHVRGVVTSVVGSQFSIMGEPHGIFVSTRSAADLRVGDAVDVVGFPSIGGYTLVLQQALYRRTGTATPPLPVVLTAAEALTGTHDAEPVRVDGQLLYQSRSPSEEDLVLSENGVTFTAALPADGNGIPPGLQPGARLRVTGICFIEVLHDKTPAAFKILLRFPGDIAVLRRPSWWTGRHALILSVLLFSAAMVVVVWNMVLRRRVRAQTRVIRVQLNEAHALRDQAEAADREKSISLASTLSLQRDLLAAQEKLRFQATHDALTGLWNRGALLDLLHREMERVQRMNISMGVLMLDIDHFKPVNDTHGHLTGDAVLRDIASRLLHATRPYDVIGRYGGEEFLILLPECDGIETWASAERIRAAVGSAPFRVRGAEIALTVSIGAMIARQGAAETELLSGADAALYQAKREGRNRTVPYTACEADIAAAPVAVNG
ncbi:MAG: diguanylate cyclase [Acidobacteriaceae bacterium]